MKNPFYDGRIGHTNLKLRDLLNGLEWYQSVKLEYTPVNDDKYIKASAAILRETLRDEILDAKINSIQAVNGSDDDLTAIILIDVTATNYYKEATHGTNAEEDEA